MISFRKTNVRTDDEGHTVADFSMKGLSTDEKPIEKYGEIRIGNGSSFYEMDTGEAYMYDEENKDWLVQ